ncbi:MAG TPA: TauD/TfdA family dioxygenase, partial [Trebonia sp.]|nr:TauD/TfdA family dioxygenase [Trebonia sp.]
TVRRIRQEILAHKVVFFRRQHHLDETTQAAFASRLGPLTTAHPTVPSLDQHRAVLDLNSEHGGGRANNWHTDVTFVERPPSFSVLRSVHIPDYGGDTVWANTARAYAELPTHLRELADRLWALHTNEFDYAKLGLTDRGDVDPARTEYAQVFSSIGYETLHPVVRVHPETGERALLLGGFARQLAGYSSGDSAALLRIFADHITALENTVRWSWAVGDVVIWDNRATQHYAVADYGTQRRNVRRITVVGEVPVSIDGTPGESKKGDASQYNLALAS